MKAPKGGPVLAALAIAAVVAAVVAGVVVIGPPGEQRARRLDERRVADLRGIAGAVDLYWTRHGELPSSLGDLAREPGRDFNAGDPDTGENYLFRPLEAERYELCALFQKASTDRERGPSRPFWSHGPGRQCFELEAKEVSRSSGRD